MNWKFRYNGRVFDAETQTQVYVLFQKADASIRQLSFIVYPINVYQSKILFLASFDAG